MNDKANYNCVERRNLKNLHIGFSLSRGCGEHGEHQPIHVFIEINAQYGSHDHA